MQISQSTPSQKALTYGRVLISSMEEGRVRLRHLRRDPRVTLSVLDKESWYTHVGLMPLRLAFPVCSLLGRL